MGRDSKRSDNGRVVRRAQVLLQLASGVSPTAVSRSLSVARSTVYRWVTQFQTAGEAQVAIITGRLLN